MPSLVVSEMCIRDSTGAEHLHHMRTRVGQRSMVQKHKPDLHTDPTRKKRCLVRRPGPSGDAE